MTRGPQRIVCLTEETTEWLYLLGEDARIVGISGYTVRPRRLRDEKPRIASFLDGRVDCIVALAPDLVIGFSDLQAALAALTDGLEPMHRVFADWVAWQAGRPASGGASSGH